MQVLFQIIITNLLVSCDGVGIISLATKDLPDRQAVLLRRVGICVAPLLALVMVWLTSYLFSFTWLHIRILGGILLIYVNYNMLRHEEKPEQKTAGRNGFTAAVVSVVAADLSMSLENGISLLSIVSTDGATPGIREITLIAIGLLVCLPLLLWLSGILSRLMERYKVIILLCAGYLVYMAVRMISEDETIDLFCRSINFQLATPTAVLIGALVVAASLFSGGQRLSVSPRRRKGFILLAFATATYALLTVGVTTFLSTEPIIDGIKWSVQGQFGFMPSGANAVYTLGTPPHLFPVIIAALSGIVYKQNIKGKHTHGYMRGLGQAITAMAVYAALYLAICTIGYTMTFGFGAFGLQHFVNILLQILLLAVYISIFYMIRSFSASRVVGTLGCLLYIFLENLLLEVFLELPALNFLAWLMPDFYSHMIASPGTDLGVGVQLLLVGTLTVLLTSWLGNAWLKKRTYSRG